MAAIKERNRFTADQLVWLDRIRIHLQENLSIDRDDFDNQPVLSDFGGWGKALRVFEGRLPQLMQESTRRSPHE